MVFLSYSDTPLYHVVSTSIMFHIVLEESCRYMCVHSLFAFSCLLPLPEVSIDAHNIWFPRQMICKTAIPKAQSCSCKNLRVNGRQEAPTLCFCATLWPFQRREALRFTRGGETKSESESEQLANLLAHLFAWRCTS